MQKNKTPKRNQPTFETEKAVFATNLRECMENKGVSQSALAQQIGVQRQTVSLYMSGQSSPNTEILTNIANALDVSADYLLGLSVVPLVNESLSAAHEYTGLSPKALENIHNWSGVDCAQRIGHEIYNPIGAFSRLCEDSRFCAFLFDITAVLHFQNDPEYTREAFLSEMEFHLGEKAGAALREMSVDDLISLVAPLNEHFGVVALDNHEAAEHYLTSACNVLKEIVREKAGTENGK